MHKLEKLNSAIDIIPLQQGSSNAMDNRRPSTGLVKAVEKNRGQDEGRIFRDPMIISRVKTYLYENEDKVYIDVTEMADYLQRKYRDYRGKKRGPFRAMVRRAYDEITENLTRQADPNWHDDEDEIDIEDDQMDEMPMNIPSFSRPMMGGRQNGNSSDKELIDISSDDDQDKIPPPVPSSTNKASAENRGLEFEMAQVAKRPHLSPSIEQSRFVSQQVLSQVKEPVADVPQKSNKAEKSRKRNREKDEGSVDVPTARKKPKDMPVVNPKVRFSNIGGNSNTLKTIAKLLVHMKHPEVHKKLGVSPPRGFLLHGPPGCGKTLLAHAIAGELEMPMLNVAATEIVAGVSGESEQRIRDLFDQACAIAPCILFIDEIDAVAPHRATAQREMERRIVAQFLSCLDNLAHHENGNKVLVLGATNRPDAIDPALRRAGRFDKEICLGIPDKKARAAILKVHTANVCLAPEVSLEKIAALTPGFVGADLLSLIMEAALNAAERIFDDVKKKNRAVVEDVIIESPPAVVPVIEEEKEKPVEVPVPDATDIIVEEPPTEKVDVPEITTTAATPEASSEEEKKSDDIPDQPASPTPETETTKTPVPESTTTTEETPAPESTTTTEEIAEPTDEATPIPETPSEPAAAVVAEAKEIEEPVVAPVVPEPEIESIDKMQVEEIRKVESVKEESEEEELEDILSWLRNEPPLNPEQLALLYVEEQDFDKALKTVQPSAKREGFATVPDVTWDDIGSLQDIRQELQMAILAPIRHSEQFAALGLTTPTGVLLCGPPGCGKTLLAKAIANEAGINFISVKGPELLNMYVGESERAVRQCFIRARNSAPCVIFFDELDALCPKRSDSDITATSRVVNQLLTEMDGYEGRKGVFLMAASNRPDIIDPAVLRPGRLDKIVYVGLPNAADRVDILRALTKNGTKPKLGIDVNLEAVGGSDRCEGYTGADLAALVREAAVESLRESMRGVGGPVEVCGRHFTSAFDRIRPSVHDKDIKHYEKLRKLYSVKKYLNTDIPMSVEPAEPTMEAMET